MSGLFKIKSLLFAMVLASPPVAAWILRGAEPTLQVTEESTPPAVHIPVEVVEKGSATEWVYVEVPSQAVPEPGVASLMIPALLLLLRRQRPGAK